MTTANLAHAARGDQGLIVDECVTDALVVAFAMVVVDEFVNRVAEAALDTEGCPSSRASAISVDRALLGGNEFQDV